MSSNFSNFTNLQAENSAFSTPFTMDRSKNTRSHPLSSNSSHQPTSSEMIKAIYGASPIKPRFGKRPPSEEPDGVFNHQVPPKPIKLMRPNLPTTQVKSANPKNADDSLGAEKPSSHSMDLSSISSGLQNITLFDMKKNSGSVENGKEWKPVVSTASSTKMVEAAAPRRVTPMEEVEATTCCSPNLSMMMSSSENSNNLNLNSNTNMQEKPVFLVNNNNNNNKSASRRKVFRSKHSTLLQPVRFQEPGTLATGKSPSELAKPVAKRLGVPLAGSQPSQNYSPANFLFPRAQAKPLYPSVSCAFAADDPSVAMGDAHQAAAWNGIDAHSPGGSIVRVMESNPSPPNAPKRAQRRRSCDLHHQRSAKKNLLASYSSSDPPSVQGRRHSMPSVSSLRRSS